MPDHDDTQTTAEPDARRSSSRARRKRRALVFAAASVVAEGVMLRSSGYGFGGRVIVRCREGHLFSTIWIPAASVKAFRLGFWRVQRCPVGKHWSVVRPVKKSSLTAEQLRDASERRDIWLP
jgi:hypothetical protein